MDDRKECGIQNKFQEQMNAINFSNLFNCFTIVYIIVQEALAYLRNYIFKIDFS